MAQLEASLAGRQQKVTSLLEEAGALSQQSDTGQVSTDELSLSFNPASIYSLTKSINHSLCYSVAHSLSHALIN